MRILLYNWRDWKHPLAGGAEIYTHRVAEQWVQQGHEVVLFCAGSPGLPELDITEGVTIVRRGNRFSVYREARKFYQREGVGKFDLVVDEINTRPFHCPAYVRDVPVIALIHQVAREIWHHQFPFPANIAGRFFFEHRWLAQYTDIPVITVSDSSRDSLRDYGLHHALTVPEGFSPPPETKHVKEDVPTVVFCGRFSKNKRPDHALSAFQRLRRHIPEARLWMIGDGEMSRSLRRRAGENVSFVGRVSHDKKFELMSRAHVLVATSVREGWGLVVTESASVGTLTVAYDVPGLRDSVQASNGVLVSPNPDALADQLRSTLPAAVDGSAQAPVAGGVASWSEVAEQILAAAPPEVRGGRKGLVEPVTA